VGEIEGFGVCHRKELNMKILCFIPEESTRGGKLFSPARILHRTGGGGLIKSKDWFTGCLQQYIRGPGEGKRHL